MSARLRFGEKRPDSPADVSEIDFAAAGLYLPGLQAIGATVACSIVSVLSCLILPAQWISAVRTLVATVAVGSLCVIKPLKAGRVDVGTIFQALRPCPFFYVAALVVEQLTHTCVQEVNLKPSLSKALFQLTTVCMLLAGFLRSNSPRYERDAPLVLLVASLVVVAIIPPPASALSGPLCQPVAFFAGLERVTRALMFSAIYSVHVYASIASYSSVYDVILCIIRSCGAATWTLTVHAALLSAAPFQIFLCLFRRFSNVEQTTYAAVETSSNGPACDEEQYSVTFPSEPLETFEEDEEEDLPMPIPASLLSNLAANRTIVSEKPKNALSFNFGDPRQATALLSRGNG